MVVVGWNGSTSQVSSVTDSKGNVYQLAVGPTVLTGPPAFSQSIYYSKNILPAAAGANVVTSILTPQQTTWTFASWSIAVLIRLARLKSVPPRRAAVRQPAVVR